MAKMPELVQLDKELADQGLVIVGINFDKDFELAEKAIEKHSLSWPQVFAPHAAKGDKGLWRDVSGIEGLPRVFLVDRRGVLREDFHPSGGLRERVQKLLAEK